jgi:N-methylhydantoinase A
MFVSASSELSQEYREFERCSTVVANAYIGPKVRRYVGEIDKHIRRDGFRGSFLIVQSTGGLYEAEQAQQQCVRMLESGPAAGVIGTQALCRTLKIDNAIAFDMGGTTAKAGVIYKGEALTTSKALIGGYDKALPVQIAMMDIFEVGTGGGSIARIEHGGLRVGPQSAGAAATVSAASSRPSPTPILCSDFWAPTVFWAGKCRSMSLPPGAQSSEWPNRSDLMRSRPPMGSCASR